MHTDAPQGALRHATTANPQPRVTLLVPDLIQRCTDVLNFFSGLDDRTRQQALVRAKFHGQMEALRARFEMDVLIARTQQVHYCAV
jgi:hypothetical protein